MNWTERLGRKESEKYSFLDNFIILSSNYIETVWKIQLYSLRKVIKLIYNLQANL